MSMDTRGLYETEDMIRDPLYGYIGISEVEREVIDTQYVQRLRGVTQLGATDMVYPSATHSRFEHSLGVMHLAGRLANSVGLSDEEVTACRLAGLLHDTGHPVWSHSGEAVAERYGIEHEERSCEVVDDVDLPVSNTLVKQYILGEAEPNIVSGILDADRMDYLLRDAYHTGVVNGQIDVDTLNRFATVINGQLGVEEKGITALNRLLNARLQMFQSVYGHEAVRRFDAELRRSLQLYVEDNTVEELFTARENELYASLLQYEPFQRYTSREPYSIATTYSEQVETEDTYRLAQQIADACEIDVSEVLVQFSIEFDEPFDEIPIRQSDGSVTQLGELSAVPASIENEYDESSQPVVYSHHDISDFSFEP